MKPATSLTATRIEVLRNRLQRSRIASAITRSSPKLRTKLTAGAWSISRILALAVNQPQV